MKKAIVTVLAILLLLAGFNASLAATVDRGTKDESELLQDEEQLEKQIDGIYEKILDKQNELRRLVWRMDEIQYQLYQLTGKKLDEAKREIEVLKQTASRLEMEIAEWKERVDELELRLSPNPSGQFANTDELNWDYPAEGKMQAYRYNAPIPYLSTVTQVRWTREQIGHMKGDTILNQYFPVMQLTADRLDRLRPKFIITDLPGAKVARIGKEERAGEAIKLSVLRASDLRGDRTYSWYSVWQHFDEEPAIWTLESKQGYAQPYGKLVDLTDKEDTLMKLSTRTAELVEKHFRWFGQNEDMQIHAGEDPLPYRSYAAINSLRDLERYRKESEERVKTATAWPRFAMTFNTSSYHRAKVKEFIDKYNLRISQIYATVVTDKDERYTAVWFDPRLEVPLFLAMTVDTRIKDLYITELEGTADIETLRELLEHPDIAIIDVADEDIMPTGVYDLMRKLQTE